MTTYPVHDDITMQTAHTAGTFAAPFQCVAQLTGVCTQKLGPSLAAATAAITLVSGQRARPWDPVVHASMVLNKETLVLPLSVHPLTNQ